MRKMGLREVVKHRDKWIFGLGEKFRPFAGKTPLRIYLEWQDRSSWETGKSIYEWGRFSPEKVRDILKAVANRRKRELITCVVVDQGGAVWGIRQSYSLTIGRHLTVIPAKEEIYSRYFPLIPRPQMTLDLLGKVFLKTIRGRIYYNLTERIALKSLPLVKKHVIGIEI